MSRKSARSLCTSLKNNYIERCFISYIFIHQERKDTFITHNIFVIITVLVSAPDEIRASHLGKIHVRRVKTQIKIC